MFLKRRVKCIRYLFDQRRVLNINQALTDIFNNTIRKPEKDNIHGYTVTFRFVYGRKLNTGGKCSSVFSRSTSSLVCIFMTGGAHHIIHRKIETRRRLTLVDGGSKRGSLSRAYTTHCTHARMCRGTSALRRAQQQQVVLPRRRQRDDVAICWAERTETKTGFFSRRVCDDGVPLLLPIGRAAGTHTTTKRVRNPVYVTRFV